MSDLVICVGGSGQHAALAIARLMHLRALPAGIQCDVIDADNSSALARSTQSLDGYVRPDFGVEHPLGISSYHTPFDARAAATGGEAGRLPFANLFLGGAADTAAIDRNVFEALFTPDDARTDVLQGFFARPTIGATAFAACSEGVATHLRNKANGVSRVFLIGSFIGGTGAGVIPSLAERVATVNNWHGVFYLNWLNPPADAAVSIATMQNGMRHGLEYFYDEVKPKLRASALIGPPPNAGVELGAATPGAHGAESPSVFHIIAARAVHHFNADTTTPYKSDVLAFNVDSDNVGELLDLTWHGGQTLLKRAQRARRAALLIGYYTGRADGAKEIAKAFSIWGTRGSIPVGIYDSIDAIKRATKAKPEVITDLLIERLHHEAGMLTSTVQWLSTIFSTERLQRNDPIYDTYERDSLSTLRTLWDKPFSLPTAGNDPAVLTSNFARYLVNELITHA